MEPEYKDFQKLQQQRRSVSHFDPEQELKDELLREIINNAVLAPSSFNLQPWEIIAVKSQDKRREIYENGACEQEKVIKAPVLLIVLGDKKGYERHNPMWDEKKDLGKLEEEKIKKIIKSCREGIYSTEAKEIGFAVRNSSLLAMSIMYSAKYFGVDSHPMIGFSAEKIKDMFDIEENKVVTVLISLGYFDENKELSPRETRLTYDSIVDEY